MESMMVQWIRHTVWMTLWIALYLVAEKRFGRRYGAGLRYYVWLILAVGLLIPVRPRITLPAGSLPLFQSLLPQSGFPIPGLEAILGLPPGGIQEARGSGAGPGTGGLETSGLEGAAGSGLWAEALALLWLAGALICLGVHLRQYGRLASLTRRWQREEMDSLCQAAYRRAAAELGIRRPPRLYRCACVKTPMMLGLLRPRILLPEQDYREVELAFILRHELIHHRRKDLWYKAFLLAVQCLYWFDPVVYPIARSVVRACERSCDQAVVRNRPREERQAYGRILLAEAQAAGGMGSVLTTGFCGEAGETRGRILEVLDQTRKRRGLLPVCLCLVLAGLAGMTFAAPAEAADPGQEVRAESPADPEQEIRAESQTQTSPDRMAVDWGMADRGTEPLPAESLPEAYTVVYGDGDVEYVMDLGAPASAPVPLVVAAAGSIKP